MEFEDAAFDFAQAAAPRHFYVLASTPRAGGTFLARQLWQTGIMGAPHEYFGFYGTMLRLAARLEPYALPDYFEALTARRTSANGVFGVKLHYDHLQFMVLSGLLSQLQPAKIVAIERQDRLAQAVSHARALQTGQWTSLNRAPRAAPAYDARLIRWCLDHLDGQRRGWQSFFEQHEATPIRIDYDAFAADPDGTVCDIVARTGFPTAPVSPVALPPIAPQSDGLNADWAARFRREEDGA